MFSYVTLIVDKTLIHLDIMTNATIGNTWHVKVLSDVV